VPLSINPTAGVPAHAELPRRIILVCRDGGDGHSSCFSACASPGASCPESAPVERLFRKGKIDLAIRAMVLCGLRADQPQDRVIAATRDLSIRQLSNYPPGGLYAARVVRLHRSLVTTLTPSRSEAQYLARSEISARRCFRRPSPSARCRRRMIGAYHQAPAAGHLLQPGSARTTRPTLLLRNATSQAARYATGAGPPWRCSTLAAPTWRSPSTGTRPGPARGIELIAS
jgi:hypothetical protein